MQYVFNIFFYSVIPIIIKLSFTYYSYSQVIIALDSYRL